MIKRTSLGLLIAITLMVGFITVTFAQRTSRLAALQPFLVDIQQTVPFSLTFTLPDTGEVVTVPSELDVALSIQIKADGSISPTVQVSKAEPTIEVTAGESHVDDLGIAYTFEIDSPDLTITEWTTFVNPNDYLEIAGESHLAPEAESFQDIQVVARFYDSDNALIAVEEIVNVGYRLKPGGYTRFGHVVYLEPEIIDHYTVSFKVIR